jgi:Glycosyl hydrolases family 25
MRRRLLLGLAALSVGGTLAAILAYHYEFQLAPLWYNVIGVDVSNHQGDIDWPALAGSKIAFAYIKATEGGDFRDKRFQLNWEGAKRAGLARGAYHFFTQCRSGAEQATKLYCDRAARAWCATARYRRRAYGAVPHRPASQQCYSGDHNPSRCP